MASSDDPLWLDSAAGPIVRPYAVTRGRPRADAPELDMLAFVTALPGANATSAALLPEHRAILTRSWEPIAVAELASHLDLALGVVRLLLGDLVDGGFVSIQDPASVANRPDSHVLKAVINGLRTI
ncbi:MAG: DUF742 domain-containing protein [Dactylosporangium sp.]|nr:DUF742 domain-containing protein [Dactylosporangium sp.]NNJ62177.1 DUF742 domain-containing protein [Dactylosporangium sp.]